MIKLIIFFLMTSVSFADDMYSEFYINVKCDVYGNSYCPGYCRASMPATPSDYCSRDLICSSGKYHDGDLIKDSQKEIISRFFEISEQITASKLNTICDNYHKQNKLK